MTRVLLFLVVTLLVAALTTGATAVRAVNRLWLRSWIEQEDEEDLEPTQRFVEQPKRLLLAAGTAVALVVFLAGALLATMNAGRPWLLLRDGVVLVTLILAFGQLLPRAIARRWAPRLVPVFVPFLRAVATVLAPIRLLARRIARLIAGWLAPSRVRDADQNGEGLQELLQDGTLDGLNANEEIAIISGVVRLSAKTAEAIMTPRADVFALEEGLETRSMAEAIALTKFSRVPIFRESLDQIVGMLHVFDLFVVEGSARPTLRPIADAELSTPAADLLYQMLRARRQLAIVRGAHGELAGLVTLEDLLEELVGEIRDEHDEPSSLAPGEAE